MARCRPLPAFALAVMLLGAAAPSLAQGSGFDTSPLGRGPYARTCTLLERTIFKVDVLTLELQLGPETAERIRRLAREGAPRDSVADVAMRSRNAFARMQFQRDVSMDRFLDGVRADLRQAVHAGVIDEETYEGISTSLPRWYDFLEDRGVRDGDEILYRIRGDTLHSGYRTVTGDWLLEQTDVGPERRLSVLGSFLVEGSSLREGLLDGLLRPEDGC